MLQKPSTIGELRASEYKVLSVKEEMRKNLINKIKNGETIFPRIIGYEETVIPQLENAIIAGHDITFIGERGQAKTRLIRSLINLMDEEIPIIKGSEINDNPYAPASKCRDIVKELGDDTEISWIKPEDRYGEKLATPDVSIADLIGEVDPIKVAEGRYLSDELTIHFGLIPRSNRGIFAINELPDLVEKVQVGLFNIMEEKDIQIKGYTVRLPLDLCIVATANPEDYTNRGRIITPLKDRFQAQIKTHYPKTQDDEISIMEQEARILHRDGYYVKVPKFIKQIIAEFTFQARSSHEINQRSGVSVRTTIANYETVMANAEKRAITMGEREVAPRITDFPAIIPSTAGKIELEYLGDDKSEVVVIENLMKRAIKVVFDSYFPSLDSFPELLESFEHGYVEVANTMPSEEYLAGVKEIRGLEKCINMLQIDKSPSQIASAVELILEGLHLSNKLNKETVKGKIIYK
ncbi:AAA family ATPase [Desulfobacterota bacterium AH_259_B03_O07]|nr:AAA family ATPase [Desulfobacterota bacterium AH_259_B03_O07]